MRKYLCDISLIAEFSYVSIGAVLMSEKIANGIRDHSGFWNHGHTYQAHPVACAAALAVQKAVQDENLLARGREIGVKLSQLLREKLFASTSPAAPFVFDIRGNGCFWGIEFDFTAPQAQAYDFKGQKFGGLVQARCLENNLIIIGMSGGANVEGTAGDHCILAPAYNTTDAEIEKIAETFVKSVEEVLVQHSSQ